MATWRKTLSSNQYYEVILNVNQTSQSIANNTSNISWSLQVRKSFGSGFWGADNTASTWSVSIDGTNVSSSSSSYDFRGGAPLTKTIANGTRTITHAGDGSKSIAVSGYWKDNANGMGSATASSTMALSTIPRASELTSFSFASHLKNGVANVINYTVSKKSTNFRHQIQLRDGSTTVLQWDNSDSNGNSSITLTASNVNTLLSRMPTNTTKTFTLRIATRSGVNGGFIGSAVTKTATGTVHADVKPVLSSMTFGIDGSRIDKTINKYVQGYTKVKASFSRTAGYGSTIKSSTITVQRTDNLDTQVINGNSGTTAKPLSRSGSYRVIYTATDERGRSTSSTSANFAVQVYSPPTISSFTLTRGETKATEVTVVTSGKFSSVGGSNTATLNIQRRSGTTWSNVGTNNTSTNGSITRTVVSTGNLVTSSYEFKMKITDLFGGVTESLDTVSTQRVVLDIHKNEGVGIGKIHERGVLDVDGGAYFLGGLYVDGISVDKAQSFKDIHPTIMSDTIRNWQLLPHGYYFVRPGEIQGQPEPYGVIEVMKQGSTTTDDYNIIWYTQGSGPVYRKSGNGTVMSGWVKLAPDSEYGSNSNGEWIRFESGVQICWRSAFTVSFDVASRLAGTWTFPKNFIADASTIGIREGFHSSNPVNGSSVGIATGTSSAQIRLFAVNGTNFVSGNSAIVRLMAIGRWK